MAIGLISILAGAAADAVPAATPDGAWTLTSLAEPATFSQTHNPACTEYPNSFPGFGALAGSAPCDSYRVVARNVGSLSSSGTVTITDALPWGLEATAAAIELIQPGTAAEMTECTLAPLRCEESQAVAPGDELVMTINVKVTTEARETVTNKAMIEGGGFGEPVSTSSPTTNPNAINGGVTPFGIEGFTLESRGADGSVDVEAADHPYALTTTFSVPTMTRAVPRDSEAQQFVYEHLPVQRLKDIVVDLPLGLIGNPQATPHCPLTALAENVTSGTSPTNCPAASRIGTVTFDGEGVFHGSNTLSGETSGIYNMQPEDGYPAEFGFSYVGQSVLMYAGVVPTAKGYRVRVMVPGLVDVPVSDVSLTFFGNPSERDGGATASTAFLTNPADCGAGALNATIEANTWEEPGHWVTAETTTYPAVTGCERLGFQPSVSIAPEVTQADSPSGYEIDLRMPQVENVSPFPAVPDLRSTALQLPQGVVLAAGAADGLSSCGQRGPGGIELGSGDALGHTVEEGEEPAAAGLPRAAKGHCAASSQIATVEIATPLLPDALTGHLYVATPRCGGEGQPACTEADAANGNLFRLYLEAAADGVVVKLAGVAEIDPHSGAIRARFTENPQLPFSDLKVRLNGGPRAPLAVPQACGRYTMSSELVPWSAPFTATATPEASFEVGGCTAGPPLAPPVSAGTLNPLAGAFSPFTFTLARHDGEQNVSTVTVAMPAGLLGTLAHVHPCPEPAAANGTCGPESLIGHTTDTVGPGSHPFAVSGSVYLTGSYAGQPFGLSIVVPAVAGPFNLGNVIVRAAIHIDPRTAALTVATGALPKFVDGVPLWLKAINVTIDRPEFMFNPTSCARQQVQSTIAGTLPSGALGTSTTTSRPFAVTGCANLPFKPSFTAFTQGRTSRANGASLDVKVAQKPGEANIDTVDVQLPLVLPARLKTLQQACTAAQFNANPAGCPAGSNVGTAIAHTPVLNNLLTGPAYLVSHGGAAFPDLVIVLQGEGVTIFLTGNTDIKKGITYSKFQTVPDAPIRSFELRLPEGPHSVLTANANLCGLSKTKTVLKRVMVRIKGRTRHIARRVRQVVPATLMMPTTIVAQNGAELRQGTKIVVESCPKTRKAAKRRAGRRLHGRTSPKRG